MEQKSKRTNISIIEVSEKERWARKVFGEILENFSKLKEQAFMSRKPREVQTRWTQRESMTRYGD